MIAQEIAGVLKKADRLVIASHYNPEGDAIGSIIALAMVLRTLGKEAAPYNSDGVPFNLEFLPGADTVQTELPDWDPDTAVIVDCGNFQRVGDAEKRLKNAPTVVNIDHHETNPRFGHVNWVDGRRASTGEMISEIIDELGVEWTPETATCIYTAIMADTGSFQFGNTSPGAMRIAARMIEYGADPGEIARFLFYDQPEKNLRLLTMVLNTMKVDSGGKVATVEITSKMFDDTGTDADATEGLVDYPRSVRGVEVAALFRQVKDSEYKISMRSKGNIDVAKIAGEFGGGGHSAAAGCTIKGSIEEVRAVLLDRINRSIDGSAGD